MKDTFTIVTIGLVAITLVVGDCQDKNVKCPEWATKGECAKNAAYMLVNCADSCNQCSCGDNDDKCAEWAAKGECASNPNYMKVQCRQSCNICTPAATTTTTTVAPCEDDPAYSDYCGLWSMYSVCRVPEVTNKYCERTCGSCN